MTLRGSAIATGAVLLALILLGVIVAAIGGGEKAGRVLFVGLLFAGGLWALIWGAVFAVHHWVPGARERRRADRMLEARRRGRQE